MYYILPLYVYYSPGIMAWTTYLMVNGWERHNRGNNMKTMSYKNVQCGIYGVDIDEHCEEAHELAEKKKFMQWHYNDGYGNFFPCSSITRTPPCGPPHVLNLQKAGAQHGWVVYRWYIAVGGLCLSLYNPETDEMFSYFMRIRELKDMYAHMRFFVPKNRLSLWERIKSVFKPSLKYHRYDVKMQAKPTERAEEYQYDIIVTEFRRGKELIYQFLNTVNQKEERRMPKTVTIYENADF